MVNMSNRQFHLRKREEIVFRKWKRHFKQSITQ